MTAKRLTKDELLATYGDDLWRQRFQRVWGIVNFLSSSILAPDYHIPDDMNNAIALTKFGTRIRDELITKHQVPAKEARMICFLEIGHAELLVDIEGTDIEALERSLEKQIKTKRLLFPFIFGRELYDRAADLFEDERPSLSYEETIKLLDGTPVGVFQAGNILIGPYGLIQSAHSRWVPPTRRIPLYHCSELTCDIVHRAILVSDRSAAINQHMSKIDTLLEAEHVTGSAWAAFFTAITGLDRESFDDRSMVTLPYLLGDALSLTEFQKLVVGLMNETGGTFRAAVDPLGIRGDAESAVDPMTRAQLLQLSLLASDREITTTLDELVARNEVAIPAGEVRMPVTNQDRHSGRFGLQAQLGRYGSRFHALGTSMGPLRLRRLVDKLYILDNDSDVSELEWQLRGVDAPTLTARLEEFVRSSTPEEVLRRLVLARRTNMITACTELGVNEHRTFDDDDLVNALLWKLGFGIDANEDRSRGFWQSHERMKQVATTAGVSALVDHEAVRALASNYFVLLEEVLDDSLAFVTWALTTDHLATPKPYAYQPDSDRLEAFRKLNEFEEARDSGPESIRYSDKNSLYELCRGFGSLTAYLSVLETESDKYRRSPIDYPRFVELTDLKQFPFHHSVPFLDLLPESRTRIVETLDEVTRMLVAADVNGVRNDQLHFRRSTADLGRLSACLAAVEASVASLEREGLTRLLFRPVREQGDRWGRKIFILADPRGREIAFARPSSFDWLRLPGLKASQYLMTAASFGEPNEILRFRRTFTSEYATMWTGYPKLRQPGPRSDSLESVGELPGVSASQ